MSVTDQNLVPRVSGSVTLPVLFTATIFLSAALLFFVQPLFAKLVLPRIGGAPAVWTTAMLFFQTVLIAGYVYAHLMIRFVPLRLQLWLHLGFWAAALMFLPLSVNERWGFDPAGSMAIQTLWLLALGVGIPFAMLSANAPLLQAWYARSGGPSAQDPYFLYGASNLGSLLALLGFPLLAEPFFGARDIGLGWAVGFVLLGLGLALSGCAAVRARTAGTAPDIARLEARLKVRQLLIWGFIAFVPSSLMLSVTTLVSTDLGAVPLIWVVPLALYILSFVVTFTHRRLPRGLSRTAALLAIAVMAVLVSNQANTMPAWIKALIFAPALFAVAIEAHRMLYARRPEAEHLTTFYITMSVGGAMGGLANSIFAPLIFTRITEGVLSVVFAGLLMLLGTQMPGRRTYLRGIFACIAVIALLYAWNGILIIPLPDPLVLALAAGLVLTAMFLWRTPGVLIPAIALFLIVDGLAAKSERLFADRSFFGTHSVRDENGLRVYANGTTVHGLMRIDEAGRPTPLSYYHPASPMAEIVTSPFGRAADRIGIVGLGVGSLACYTQPGQDWHFYEIDPMVDRVARDPGLFRFMSTCAGDAPTHLGDARMVLARQDLTFDVLVLDAYSSDAIPVHLVTAEALAMYLDRLTPSGILVFHISNRYYDLRQPLARIGAPRGLSMAIREDFPDRDDPANKGASASVVVAMSPDPARIDEMTADGRWQPLVSDGGAPWTDDHANLLSALR